MRNDLTGQIPVMQSGRVPPERGLHQLGEGLAIARQSSYLHFRGTAHGKDTRSTAA